MSLQALLTAAAFAPIEKLGWLRVTGEDRLRWLNGMTTNNIAALTPGQGCYTFFLNAQGRILADATAFLLEDSILLETASPGSLATMLDHFIIMDDVELDVLESGGLDRKWFAETQPEFPRPTKLGGLFIAGPEALPIVAALGTQTKAAAPCTSNPPAPASLNQPPHLKQTLYAGAPVNLIRAHSPLVPRFELWSDPATLASIVGELNDTAISRATEADLEQLRILSGTPLYGTDIRNTETHKDLPQETAQTHALHFSKGCYLGQEIVERIRSRGSVHRTFTGFLLTPDPVSTEGAPGSGGFIADPGVTPPPTPGTKLSTPEAPDKPIGELTSVAATPFGLVALGYLRREILDTGKRIQYPGGTATPSALPFPIDPTKRA